MSVRKFESPDGGAWEIESAHVPRPISTFAQAPIERAVTSGFREGTTRYGLLLDTIELRFVHGFAYMRRLPVGVTPEQAPKRKRPPKLIFQLMMHVLPSIRRRIKKSSAAMAGRLWREDLRRWDEETRPGAVRAHLRLQGMEPANFSDEDLLAHVLECRDHLEAMFKTHYSLTITCYLPIGDLIARVNEWTGHHAGDILQALRGSSQISLGVAGAELDELLSALRKDEVARQTLESNAAPQEVLDRLVSHRGLVGAAAKAYLDVIGFRCVGYDVGSKYASEMPELLVRTLRASFAARRKEGTDPEALVARVRAAVPEKHRAQFDALLVEARHINRLREERGHYCDGWATGLARRALIEAGNRLVSRGLLDDREHAVDLTGEELANLLRGAQGPSKSAISERAAWRSSKSVSDPDVPPWLGAKPREPPPLDWLPQAARRPQQALQTFLSTLWAETATESTLTSVTGLPVSPGVYEGTARLVHDEADFVRIHKGDVLVTRTTSPYFNVVLPLLGAIVTDRGGQLCHAAIVSREYGIPGVVGTREATKIVKDGARVRVNGDTGEVQVLA